MIYRRAKLLLAMSEYSRELIVEAHGIPADKVELLPPPPSRGFLELLSTLRPHARREEMRPELRLLFVGRVDDPRKNFGLLIAALQRLRGRGVAAHLTVAGPHTRAWHATLQKHEMAGAITVLGRIPMDALVAAYCSHDLLVVPSRQEGYGLVVAEALHAGLPIVATRCGGPEGMIRSSQAGILTEHTAEALSGAIERLAIRSDERAEMSRRARTFAERELSTAVFQDRVADATARLLRVQRRHAA
jgi:glycosyltransferase involved in cell wall biosynthesis